MTIRRRFASTSLPFPGKIAVVGAGSFGSAMTRMMAKAVEEHHSSSSDVSEAGTSTSSLAWYARRQIVVDEINQQRTNLQYFPGGVFPDSVQATTDLHECVKDAKVVVLAVPAAYLPPTLQTLKDQGSLSEGAVIVSVLKSLKYNQEEQRMVTCVDQIKQSIPGFPVTALSGPNLYAEMASDDEFAEATIGYDQGNEDAAKLVQLVTSSSCFQTSLTSDLVGLELCGGLKNVISLAVGYVEGLGLGWNARSSVIRAGMHEMSRFVRVMEMGQPRTVFETSCGVGDLVLTCTAGRGRKLAAAFVTHGLENGACSSREESITRWEELENNLLNGMKLPDWHNAQYVHQALTDKAILQSFPLFEAVYQIGFEGHNPRSIVDALSKSIIAADAEE
jgi:glycerol-3-phosphate dehydrogenase (NAD+)